jgi:hypothetical protein
MVPSDRPTTIRAGVRLTASLQTVTLSTFSVCVALLSAEVESEPRSTRVALTGLSMDVAKGTATALNVELPGIETGKEPGLNKLPLTLSHV